MEKHILSGEPSASLHLDEQSITSEADLDDKIQDSCDKVLLLANMSGPYQKRIVFLGSILMLAAGFVGYLGSYLAADPITKCQDSDMIYRECSEKQACELMNDPIRPSKIHFETEGWSKEYGLYCDRDYIRIRGKTYYLITNLVMCSAIIFVCDIYGRMFGIKLTLFIVLVGSAMSIGIDEYLVKMVGLGISNVSVTTFTALLPVLLSESTTLTAPIRSQGVNIFYILLGLGCIGVNMIAYISTKPNFLILATLIIFLAGGIPFLWVVREGPAYSLKKLDIVNFATACNKIGEVNKVKPPVSKRPEFVENMTSIEKMMQQAKIFKEARKKKSWKQRSPVAIIITNKSHVWKIFVLSMIYSFMNCIFTGLAINIQELGDTDIRVNGMLYGLMQIIGLVISLPMIDKVNRKKTTILLQLCILLGAFALLGLSFVKKTDIVSYLNTGISTVVIGTGIAILYSIFYLYFVELFEVGLRATSNSMIIFVSNCVSILLPYLSNLCQNYGIHVMVGCSVVGLISFPLTFTLKNTS